MSSDQLPAEDQVCRWPSYEQQGLIVMAAFFWTRCDGQNVCGIPVDRICPCCGKRVETELVK